MEKTYKDIKLSKSEKRFVERMKRVSCNLSFFATSFAKWVPDCDDCLSEICGQWSIGSGRLSEPIEGDWGSAVIHYLLGNDKKSEKAYKAIQDAEMQSIKDKHFLHSKPKEKKK